MQDEENFARLRNLLTASPSRKVWGQLCDLFEMWPEGEDKRIAVEYADTHLHHWPERHREMPSRWMPLFRRGEFPSHLLLPHTLSSHSIQGISVLQMEAAFDALAQTRIRRIELAWTNLAPGVLKRLAERESFLSIELLRLQSATVGANWEHIEPFLISPYTRNLRSLQLSGFKAGLSALRRLCESESLDSLQHLDLSWNNLSGDDFTDWLGEPVPLFEQLRHLDLSWNRLGMAGAEFLGSLDWFNLRGLRLVEVGLGNRGVNALSHGEGSFPELKYLSLSSNQLTDGVFATLEDVSLSDSLSTLDLSQNQITMDGVQELLKLSFVEGLEELNLSYCPLENSGVKTLASSSLLHNLQGLLLSHTKMDGTGARALFDSPHLKHLRWLDIDNNQLDDQAILGLSQSTTLRELKTLCMGGGQVSRETLLSLLSSPVVAKVQNLNLPKNWKDLVRGGLEDKMTQSTPWKRHWDALAE